MSSESLDSAVVLSVAAKLQQMLTDPADPQRIVSVATTPFAYQATSLRFTGARDAAQENTLAEFSELVNRIPTAPVWNPQPTLHLWDVYGEVLRAELAQDDMSPQERSDYEGAQAYLFDAAAGGGHEPSAALRDYRVARQAWLQASIDYRQAEAAGVTAADPAVRAQWQDIEEPKLRQARDDAATAWNVNGHKIEVDEALRKLTELGAKSPRAVWDRHRDTFNPNLPDQFNTSPNGIRFAPTFFAPGDVLDSPWPRVQLDHEQLVGLVSDAAEALTDVLGGEVRDDLQSVSFDYCVVSISRPWLDPAMELFGSRGWRFAPSTPALTDGADPPAGRCPAFVETAALIRNIETVFTPASEPELTSTGDHALVAAGTGFDLDTGSNNGDSPDFRWERVPDIEGGFNLVGSNGARLAGLGWPGTVNPLGSPEPSPSFDALGPDDLNHGSHVWLAEHQPIKFGGEKNAEGLWIRPDRHELHDRYRFAVLTTRGNLAKVEVRNFGETLHIRWVTYKGSGELPVTRSSTDPSDVYIAAYVCRRLPQSPDPDPNLAW